MEDVPQPSSEPFSDGDRVRIYLDPSDTDARYHGLECCVVDVHTDSLSSETGRALDAYSYTLEDVESGEELPVAFRHQDLIPADKDE